MLKAQVVAKIGALLRKDAFVPGVDFSRWGTIANDHRAEIDAASMPEEFSGALVDALKDFGVSHMFVTPPGSRVGEKVDSPGFMGDEYREGYVVTRVFDGTDAQRLGFHPGTFLKQFVWVDRRHLEVVYVDDSQTTRKATLTLGKAVMKTAPTLVPLAPDAFVLSVQEFSAGYDAKVVDRLMARAVGARYLLIDLRGNTGGQPPRVDHLLGYFLPAGTRVGAIVQMETLRGQAANRVLTAEERAAIVAKVQGFDAIVPISSPVRYAGHLAVLIDGDTASAGEIAARALRDYAGAQVFGSPSAGMVVAATGANLPGGYQLVFPYGDYWTAKGERMEGRQVVPDFPVRQGSDEAGPSPIPLRIQALKWLREKYPAGG